MDADTLVSPRARSQVETETKHLPFMSNSMPCSVDLMSSLDDMTDKLTSLEYDTFARGFKKMYELEGAVKVAKMCLGVMADLINEKNACIERLQKERLNMLEQLAEPPTKRRRRYS